MESIQIANMIATRRKQLSLTQQQIADVLGVTNKAVSKWETGELSRHYNYSGIGRSVANLD